jgi:hypothetical protein
VSAKSSTRFSSPRTPATGPRCGAASRSRSLAGGEPATLTPQDIAAAWASGLAPIEAIHHQVGNLSVKVSETEATASCYGIAYHYRRTYSGQNTRVFVGSYDFHLQRRSDGWRIDLFRFKVKFVDGNLELDKEAGA